MKFFVGEIISTQNSKSLTRNLKSLSKPSNFEKLLQNIGENYIGALQINPQVPLSLKNQFLEDLKAENNLLAFRITSDIDGVLKNSSNPDMILTQFSSQLQRSTGRFSGIINNNDQKFRTYIALNSLKDRDYTRFLYWSEESNTTCNQCDFNHGKVYSIKELVSNNIIPQIHPNCKCKIIAMDKNSEEYYNYNRENFLNRLGNILDQPIGGVFLLDIDFSSIGLSLTPFKISNNPAITGGSKENREPKWYEKWKDTASSWAKDFLSDAKDLWYDKQLNKRGTP